MFEDCYVPNHVVQIMKPKNAAWVAEQYALVLGDKTEDNLRIKLEHDARVDLFLANALVVHERDAPDLVARMEQLEMFPVFTVFNTRDCKITKIRDKDVNQ